MLVNDHCFSWSIRNAWPVEFAYSARPRSFFFSEMLSSVEWSIVTVRLLFKLLCENNYVLTGS